jgi:Uma2 family endonuclease
MNIIVAPLIAPVAPDTLPIFRLSVAQYHAMIDAAVLNEGDRCELVEGVLIEKMTRHPPHDGSLLVTQTLLTAAAPPGWVVRVQSAVTLRRGEPEPDLVVARGTARSFFRAHPGPKEIGLVVEISDSTLALDRGLKRTGYARNGLPVYWIVNLVESHVEVYTDPKGGRSPGYRRRQDYGPDAAVPLVLGGREVARIPVRELLP